MFSGYMGGVSPNWGNKLWFQGLYSEIDTPENTVVFRTTETAAEINDRYDLIIWPMANLFGLEYCSNTDSLIESIKGITIPIYVIACGVQAENYDSLDELINQIGGPASRFIEAIYATGGEFALRGYFTKEFFDRLGFSSAVVTGCPSLYQLGSNLSIKKQAVVEWKPILNGRLRSFEDIMMSVPGAQYFSQGEYFPYLYSSDFELKSDWINTIRFVKRNGFIADFFAQERIKLIVDMNAWYHYIKTEKFNFSIGTRIHGNIMSILAGIPSVVLAVDSRTREMAEFFEIPCLPFDRRHKFTTGDMEKIYTELDYTAFNRNFSTKYFSYEKFLQRFSIITKINENNAFISEPLDNTYLEYNPNKDKFDRLAQRTRLGKAFAMKLK